MKTVFLLLGSNLGDKRKNISRAIELISENVGHVIQQSSLYETAAWGKTDQPSFYNQAIEVATRLTPKKLLQMVKKNEQEIGRTVAEKWSARIIDIDIVFYGKELFRSNVLVIPHPFMQERRFVLAPLNEIAPDFIHPILQQSVRTLLEKCKDTLEVKRI